MRWVDRTRVAMTLSAWDSPMIHSAAPVCLPPSGSQTSSSYVHVAVLHITHITMLHRKDKSALITTESAQNGPVFWAVFVILQLTDPEHICPISQSVNSTASSDNLENSFDIAQYDHISLKTCCGVLKCFTKLCWLLCQHANRPSQNM